MKYFNMLGQNFECAETTIHFKAQTGAKGAAKVLIASLFTQFPVLLDSGFTKDKQIWGTLVPFKFGVKPLASGDVTLDLTHVLNLDALKMVDRPMSAGADSGPYESIFVSVRARKPQISIILDQKATLNAGAELFSLVLGPRLKGATSQPPAANEASNSRDLLPLFDSGHKLYSVYVNGITSKARNELMLTRDNLRNMLADLDHKPSRPRMQSFHEITAKEKGVDVELGARCPVLVRTAPGVKMTMKVPEVAVDVAFPSLVRFLSAHFQNLPALKDWLEETFGGIFIEERLSYFRTILNIVEKYLCMPGMSVACNLNVKVTACEHDVAIRIQTPEALPVSEEKSTSLSEKHCLPRNVTSAVEKNEPTASNTADGFLDDSEHEEDQFYDRSAMWALDEDAASIMQTARSNSSSEPSYVLDDETASTLSYSGGKGKNETMSSALLNAVSLGPEASAKVTASSAPLASNSGTMSPEMAAAERVRFAQPIGTRPGEAARTPVGSAANAPLPYAMKADISFNVMDVLADGKIIAKAMQEANAAIADLNLERASFIMRSFAVQDED